MDLVERFGLDGVFAGDPGVSAAEQQRILRWCETGETDIPCTLAEGYRHLYGVPFTCRPDSPSWLVRFQESRQYAEPGREVAPAPAQPRPRGAITMDNALYGRYSGEIQLIRSSLPADERVNVIGAVSSRHMLLADRLHASRIKQHRLEATTGLRYPVNHTIERRAGRSSLPVTDMMRLFTGGNSETITLTKRWVF